MVRPTKMHIALSLVGVTFLAMQCHSRAVKESDRHYPAGVETQQKEQDKSLLQHTSRATKTNQHPLEKGSPKVEQFLKEVTPTTKTVYDPQNQKAESHHFPLYERFYEESYAPTPIAQNILAIQNAILARQNAIYEQQRADQLQKQLDSLPHSLYFDDPIEDYKYEKPEQEYVYYTDVHYEHEYKNGKKNEAEPKREDVAESPEEDDDEEEENEENLEEPDHATPDYEVVYYTDSGYEHEYNEPKDDYEHSTHEEPKKKKQEQKSKVPTEEDKDEVYYTNVEYEHEVKSPAPAKFQAKLPKKQPTPKVVYNQIIYQPENDVPEPKDKVYVSDVKFEKNIVYQPGQPHIIHYHLQPAGTNYEQQSERSNHKQQTAVPSEVAVQKYRNDVPRYHTVANNAVPRRVVVLVPQQAIQPIQYRSEPKQNQPYLGPSEEEYRQSQVKQKLGRNSNLRVLKTGKPVVFIGHEE